MGGGSDDPGLYQALHDPGGGDQGHVVLVRLVLHLVGAVPLGDEGQGPGHVEVLLVDDARDGAGERAHALPELHERVLVAAEQYYLVLEERRVPFAAR